MLNINALNMRTTASGAITAAFLLAAIAAGCDRMNTAPKPVTASETGHASGPSVALPSSSLPPSDAALKPAAPDAAGSSGQASNQTQATPNNLTKEQQTSSMPMPGQVNNYSTTESNDRQSQPGQQR